MEIADLTWDSLPDALMVLARLMAVTAMLVLIGGIIFLATIRIPSDVSRRGRWLDHRAHRFLWVAWLVALTGSVAGVLLGGAAEQNLPVSAALRPDIIGATLESRWGMAALVRVGFLLVVALLLLAGWPWPRGRRRTAAHRRPGWLVAAALLLTPPLGGHAGGGPDPVFGVVVGWLHFASAAVWLGGLILLVGCAMPRLQVRLRDYVPQFSAIATVSILAATVTGTVQSWRQLGSLDALTSTSYGQFLIAKCLAFGLLSLIALGSHTLTKRCALDGATAPRRVGPGAELSAHGAMNGRRLRQFVMAEVVVAVLVLVATELMAHVEPGRVELAATKGRPVSVVREAPSTVADQSRPGRPDAGDGADRPSPAGGGERAGGDTPPDEPGGPPRVSAPVAVVPAPGADVPGRQSTAAGDVGTPGTDGELLGAGEAQATQEAEPPLAPAGAPASEPAPPVPEPEAVPEEAVPEETAPETVPEEAVP
jgi:copper transport protein